MIQKSNIKELLSLLNYVGKNGVYYKEFNNEIIKVDINNEKIYYPSDLIVHDESTSNFNQSENFVVFECVNRLLSKGYKPKNIELEPRWQVGRGSSGGKADILVRDYENHEYLIIECKTYGDEYDKAWARTKSNGGQLFSYAQQIKRTQYLCLYSSDIEDNKIYYFNKIITIKDNEEYLKTLKEGEIKRFKDANDVKELYSVWKDIYNLEFEETGIFEKGILPYEINKSYTLSDLKLINFEDTQKKYDEFATILRQHNVSSHENAFDKLVNIFFSKIVDEIQHPNCLQFNWKGTAHDDYYQLQDRLQKLYKEGMQKFLNEEVTYIDNKQLNDAFKLFKNDPDATKNIVMNYFRELKFYTNNDFAFIDVHNEKLFKQNSEILLKIIRLFQDIKLKTDEQNQFLGDLFEGFLDDGVKQSEGQFFTPLPITRFIISSLPLEEIINNSDEPPKVIDYACGAGHFLTEYTNQIKTFLDENQLHDYYSQIYGIEKEYRLSKVSKVSSFMYGQDEINIIYGDALVNNDDIKDNSYDILISNPPYSVKGFLETLTDEEREKYELFSLINKHTYSTNNSIETFFVERAKQLLKDGGVAGIILPSSILTKNDSLYVKTREILISNFDIISIVELPSGTFSATGTNTVILFLRKKENNPSLAEHFKNRVNSWFDNKFDKDVIFEDKQLLYNYLDMQNMEYDDYLNLFEGKISKNLKNNKIFKQYLNDDNLNDISKIIKLEKEKLYYYMLISSQDNKILIVNAPTNTNEREEFLGYKWSSRRGREGIKYARFNSKEKSLSRNKGINTIKTRLFNPEDLNDEDKINTIIKDNFINSNIKNNDYVHYIAPHDLINFERNTFDKSINLNINTKLEIKSKYPLKTFNEILVDTRKIKNIGTKVKTNKIFSEGKIPVVSQNRELLIDGYTNDYEPITDFPLIVFGDHTCCFKYIDFEFVRGADGTQILLTNNDDVRLKYLYYISFFLNIPNSNKYERHFKYLKDVKVPIPPLKIQDQIIVECSKIDEIYEKTRMSIDEYKNKIEDIFIRGGAIIK